MTVRGRVHARPFVFLGNGESGMHALVGRNRSRLFRHLDLRRMFNEAVKVGRSRSQAASKTKKTTAYPNGEAGICRRNSRIRGIAVSLTALPKREEDAMSSNKYSGYVSQNLARSSPFGYKEEADLRALLENVVARTAERNQPLAAMSAFLNFGMNEKTRMRAIRHGRTPLPV